MRISRPISALALWFNAAVLLAVATPLDSEVPSVAEDLGSASRTRGCFLSPENPTVSTSIKVIADDPRPAFVRSDFRFKWYDRTQTLRMAFVGNRPSSINPFLDYANSDPLESFTWQVGNLGVDPEYSYLRFAKAGLPFVVRDGTVGERLSATVSIDAVEIVPIISLPWAGTTCSGVYDQFASVEVEINVIEESSEKRSYEVDVLSEFMGSFRGPLYNIEDASYADNYLSDALSNGNKAIVATGNTFGPAQLEGEVNNAQLTLRLLSLLNVQAINVGVGELNHLGYDLLTTMEDASTNYRPPFLSSNIYVKDSQLHAFEPHRIVEVQGDEDVLKIAVFGVMSQQDVAMLDGEVSEVFDIRPDYARWINERCVILVGQGEAHTCIMIHSDGVVRDGDSLNLQTEFAKTIYSDENFSIFTALVGASTEQTINAQSSNGYSVIVQGQQRGGVVQLSYEQDINVPEHVRCTAKLATMAGNSRRAASKLRELPALWESAKTSALNAASQMVEKTEGYITDSYYRGRDLNQIYTCSEEGTLPNLAADAVLSLAVVDDDSVDLALVNCEAFAKDLIASDPTTENAVSTLDLWHLVKDDEPLKLVDLTGNELATLLASQFGVPGLSLRSSISVSANAAYRFDSSQVGKYQLEAANIVINGYPVEPSKTYRAATTSHLASLVRKSHLGQMIIPERTSLDDLVTALATHLSQQRISTISTGRGVDVNNCISAIELTSAKLNAVPKKTTDFFDLDFYLASQIVIDEPVNFYLRESATNSSRLVYKASGFSPNYDSLLIRVRTTMSKHAESEVEIWGAIAAWPDQSYSPALSFRVSVPSVHSGIMGSYFPGIIAVVCLLYCLY